MLEKPKFNWNMQDMYLKLKNFRLEIASMLETRTYEIRDEEKLLVIKNWLG